ncbi:MAG: hypothetical protein ACYCTB_11930 [bacterium]
MFNYVGGIVTRKKLEEAIDLFVQIETDYQEAVNRAVVEGKKYPNINDIAKNYPDNEMAEEAVKQYAMQIQPKNDLENMQKAFYGIVNSEEGFRRAVASDYLRILWDGIGDWMK